MSQLYRQMLQKALAVHQQGQFAAAIQQYNAVLAIDPNNFDALHLKGLALYQSGDAATAVELLTRAIRRNGAMPAAFNNRGLALQALGRKTDALADFSKAVSLDRNHAEAQCNKGNLLRELGRLSEAKAACEAAIRLNPRVPQFYNSLGVVLKEERDWPAALAQFDQALRIHPAYLEAIVNRANALKEMKRLEEALAGYDRAIAMRPDYPEAHGNRGNALLALLRFDEALAAFDRAAALRPDDAETHNNRAALLIRMMRLEEAVAACDRALAARPDYVDALLNRGQALNTLGRYEEGCRSLDRVLALRPDSYEALARRGAALHARGLFDAALADSERALALSPDAADAHHFRAQLLSEMLREEESTAEMATYLRLIARNAGAPEAYAAQWSDLLSVDAIPAVYESEAHVAATRERVEQVLDRLVDGERFTQPLPNALQEVAAQGLNHLMGFYLAYHQRNDRETMRKLSAAAARLAGLAPTVPDRRPRGDRPIRLGIASQRLRNHNGSNWAYNWLAGLPRGDYEFFTYNFEGITDDLSGKFAALGSHRQMTFDPATEPAILARIAGDRLDALMFPDIGMTPLSRFLSLHRLAPLQFTAWGHPVTSGSTEIDCYLSSDLMEPAHAQEHYTEELVRLPNLALCLDPPGARPGAERNFGLPEGRVLYGCLQSLFKYLPRHDVIYPEIALRVPDALFVFINGSSPQLTAAFRQRLERAFAAKGLDGARHLLFMPRMPDTDFDSLMRQVHVNVDSIGWSGGNTSIKAISFAAPLVTLEGDFMRGRHTSAMFAMMGLPELVSTSLEAYVEKLAGLGREEAARRHVSELFRLNAQKLWEDRSVPAAFDAFLKQRCG